MTVVELIVVAAVLFVLASALTPGISNAPLQANMTAVGSRGRDIFVAIERANAERVPLGLPPLWPKNFDSAFDSNREALAELDFDTSTEYFKWLIDEPHLDTPQWSPRVTGVDYSKFAGAGVPACPNRNLTATNNLWTVVKNVRPDMDGAIPVLVTRNIDASSLAPRVTEGDIKTKSLRFDPAWRTPFSDKGYVMIRKGGGVFKARRKYMSYAVICETHIFDTTRTPDGRIAPPLKYLTPTREVTPGEKAYVEGAAIAYQLAGGWWGKVKRVAVKCSISLFLIIFYLLAFVCNFNKRRQLCLEPPTSAPIIGVWVCHYFEVNFYVVGIMFGVNGDEWAGAYMVAALVAQALGITLAVVFQRHDRETRRQQIKWLLVPFWVVLVSSFLIPAV